MLGAVHKLTAGLPLTSLEHEHLGLKAARHRYILSPPGRARVSSSSQTRGLGVDHGYLRNSLRILSVPQLFKMLSNGSLVTEQGLLLVKGRGKPILRGCLLLLRDRFPHQVVGR